MNIPQAWIFDLDGVIVETSQLHFNAWKKLADTLDISFTKKDNEALKGVSRSKSLEIILSLDNRDVTAGEFEELMARKNSWYREYLSMLTPADILEGVPEFLSEIKKMKAKLAIGSSSKNAKFILNHLNLTDAFDVIIDGSMARNSKPDPEIFLKGAAALNIKPENCIVFEDAESGVEAALAGGMTCVGVGFPEILGKADLVVPGFKNITPEQVMRQLNFKMTDHK